MFSEEELKAVASRLNVEGIAEMTPDEQKKAMLGVFTANRDARVLLNRAGKTEDAVKILKGAGVIPEAARAFLALRDDRDVSVPSAYQLQASTNLKEGETRVIIAVPGSGKTTSLVSTVEEALAFNGIKPNEVMVFSYSRSAAKEINDRIMKRNPDLVGSGIKISTAHALARSIVKKYEPDNRMDILSDNDRDGKDGLYQTIIPVLLSEIQKAAYSSGRNISTSEFEAIETNLRSNLSRAIPATRLAPWDRDQLEDIAMQYGINGTHLARGVELYNQWKAEHKKIDFEDMILEAINILTTNKEAREEVQAQCRLMLVDEYQDTSSLQRMFEECLRPEGGIKCMVGDDGQAIFTSLGANANIILNDALENPDNFYILPVNYRSTKAIIRNENDFQATMRDYSIDKKLMPSPMASEGEKPELHLFTPGHNGESKEVEWIAKTVEYELHEKKTPPEQIMVQYRWKREREALEKAFRSNPRIAPYLARPKKNPIIANFLENRESHELRPIAESLGDPSDALLFDRLLQQSIGKNIADFGIKEDDKTPFETFSWICNNTLEATNDMKAFARAYSSALGKNMAADAISLFRNGLAAGRGYEEHVPSEAEKAYLTELKVNNVSRTDIDNFYSLVETDVAEGSNLYVIDKPGVGLATIHKNKGLEFATVITAFCSEESHKHFINRIPSERVKRKTLHEAANIMNVAASRAKTTSYFSATGQEESDLAYCRTDNMRVFIDEEEYIPEKIQYQSTNKPQKEQSGTFKLKTFGK